jgi:hypothetical protein
MSKPLSGEFVRIEIEFELPQNTTIEACCRLVMNQMRASPEWEEPGGTGLLNYVCHDRKLRIVSAVVREA